MVMETFYPPALKSWKRFVRVKLYIAFDEELFRGDLLILSLSATMIDIFKVI
jgi:hypothetical protein